MGFPIASRAGTASGPPGSDEPSSSAADRLAFGVAVVGGAGLVPVAPGTAGSLAAVGAFLGLVSVWPAVSPLALLVVALGAAIVATFFVGVWAADRAERITGRSDDGRIVIDEVVGQWIALLPVAALVPGSDFSSLVSPFSLGVVTAFVAFRVFDVWKPGAVRWAERRFEGGLGVMADDVVAGAYGAVVVSFVLLVAVAIASPADTGDALP